MASRKNKWRTVGKLQFRRETKRYTDGTPWGCDVLYVRRKGVACAVVDPSIGKPALQVKRCPYCAARIEPRRQLKRHTW